MTEPSTRPITIDTMRADVAELLDLPATAIGDQDDLLRTGLDSIGVMRLAGRWQRGGVTFGDLIEWRTLAQWWALVTDGEPACAPAGLAPVDEQAPFDLATMQHAYWVGRADDQVLGGVGAHFYVELDGAGVDPVRLEHAVWRVIDRHGMLRARFLDTGQQRIDPESAWPGLTVHDFRALSPVDAERRAAGLRDELSHRRLRVADGEVFDVQLSLLPGGTTRVHVHIEMMVCDAHSFQVLLGDLARSYADPHRTLPPVGLSFPGYLALAEQHRAQEREQARKYWLDRVPELPDGPDLPLAVRPEQLTGHRVTRRYHAVAREQWQLLAERSREQGITLSATFLTAFALALGGWSAQPRFLLNLPVYDRRDVHPAVSSVVGDFVNLVLLDVDLRTPCGFAELAGRLQRQLHEDVTHDAFSGVEVLRELTRHRKRTALAPVVFTSAFNLGELFDANVRAELGTPGWTMSQNPQVWLDFQVTERDGGLLLNWDAVEELFAPGVLDGLFEGYRKVLDWLSQADHDWHATVPGLLPDVQARVRAEVNASQGAVGDGLLHQGFFEWAERAPSRIAVVSGDETVSFGELRERALRVAGALTARGVQAGDVVGVSLLRGVAQIAAVLGVLAAGAAYVPMGVGQPAARRERMCAAAGIRIVLGDGEIGGVEVLPAPESGPPLDRPVPVSPDDLAYVIFTSGSTGLPKGVEITHRQAMNTVVAVCDQFGVGADDRVLAVSALDFDLSVFDVFGLLSAGGSLVLIDETEQREAARWADLVDRWGVTVWNSVPALLDMLVTASPAGLPSLRLALVSGDWVGLDLPARFTEKCGPDARFVALGGATEGAIWSNSFEVTGSVPEEWRSIPYGTPLPNQCYRVVDGWGRDCPDWVPGELWIGGAGVALGYRGDPAKTAEKFVQHDGTRWYRTGDVGRYWPDGTLEFLGRKDFQVKVGGHRIELGEIEAALLEDDRVDAAVAFASGSPRRLVAAVTGTEADGERLRTALAARLPGYMVPDCVQVFDGFPLSANGKIDRAALHDRLAAEPVEASLAELAEPPRGPMELALARIWSEQLGTPVASRTQSFFALGGDSLQATRILATLRAEGIQGGDLRTLFEAPTLADFAAQLTAGNAVPERPVLAADPAARYEPFPATDVQQAYWIGRSDGLELGGVGSHWYWEFDGADVDLARLEDALNLLVARHEMLRAIFDPDGRQRILPEVPRMRIDAADARSEADLAEFRAAMSHRIADPGQWPLLEVRALRHGTDRTRLGFSFDFIVLDALSIMTVLSELSALYTDLSAELRPVGVSFRDYLLNAKPSTDEIDAAKRYWTGLLDDLPPAPQLPVRADAAALAAPKFTRREKFLPADRWTLLAARARQHNLTPITVLSTVYAHVLSAWSDRPDLTLNLTLFDRRDVHPDIDHVLGDFTSLMLVPWSPRPADGFAGAARNLQEQVWTGMEHRAVSAIWVLRELAKRTGRSGAGMPVVLTSALGLGEELAEMSFPFGEPVWGASQTPQVWLDFQVTERDGGLLLNWDAVEDLFAPGVLDGLFGGFAALLDWLLAADADWSDPVPSVLPADQALVRAEVNATHGQLEDRLLHSGFFEQAERAPSRIAVVSGEETMSFGEVRTQALRVAGALAARGIGAGDVVGVSLPRGAEQVAAVLGVLAAGAAYVPMGVDQPAARRERICTAAGIGLVVGEGGLTGVTVLSAAEIASAPALDRPVPVSPDELAYVIFTSGSTGQPKGVEITHRAAMNTIADVSARFGITADDRVLAVSALDFDLSVFDVFGLLSAGGSLVLIDDTERREAARWAELADRWGVTVWNSVPALLDMALVAGLSSPRLALVSGDWVGLDLPGRFLDQCGPAARFVALGGATEGAIWSNFFEVTGGVPEEWRSIPYGTPLRNQCYRVVDGWGRDCPDWVPGELWIGGAGVARGYRGDPERTAEKFVEHDGAQWYRTGDLGRYWPDGTLEFLGRKDFQVKIGGHRIELGEIEAALLEDDQVTAAVAFAMGSPRRLVAAVTGTDADHLRTFLATRLPSYMVPDRVELFGQFPLSANGKIDRTALQNRLAAAQPELDDAPPEGELEETLAALWCEVLELDRVGRNQSFFALGGDSLQATRLVNLVRRRWAVDIPLRRLLEQPNIAALAQAVAAAEAEFEDFEQGVL